MLVQISSTLHFMSAEQLLIFKRIHVTNTNIVLSFHTSKLPVKLFDKYK